MIELPHFLILKLYWKEIYLWLLFFIKVTIHRLKPYTHLFHLAPSISSRLSQEYRDLRRLHSISESSHRNPSNTSLPPLSQPSWVLASATAAPEPFKVKKYWKNDNLVEFMQGKLVNHKRIKWTRIMRIVPLNTSSKLLNIILT